VQHGSRGGGTRRSFFFHIALLQRMTARGESTVLFNRTVLCHSLLAAGSSISRPSALPGLLVALVATLMFTSAIGMADPIDDELAGMRADLGSGDYDEQV
jgi:hypothetical protein